MCIRDSLPEELDIVQVHQPVGVVEHQGLALREVDELAHLLLDSHLFLRAAVHTTEICQYVLLHPAHLSTKNLSRFAILNQLLNKYLTVH